MIFDYLLISKDLLNELSPRSRQVISRRFGLDRDEKETLQGIGGDYGITRERVRQIERTSLNEMRDRLDKLGPVFDFFHNQLKIAGGARREDIYLCTLGPNFMHPHILLLLNLNNDFERVRETSSLHNLWTDDKSVLERTKEIIDNVYKRLRKEERPVSGMELERLLETEPHLLFGALEVSKKICLGPQGLWGLREWPDINPRGTRDRAYIVLKSEAKPLHFKEIAEIINSENMFSGAQVHPQTVHNELIKEPRFVLVGRGTYALREWGYEPGTVEDVILRVLREKGPLRKGEIIDEVLGKRMVKKNTVLLNLRRSEEFMQDADGRYKIKV